MLVQHHSQATLKSLQGLTRGKKIAEVKEEVDIVVKPITHTHYEHQQVSIKVQTLANFRKAITPIFESVKNSIQTGEIDALPQLAEVRAFKRELERMEEFLAKRALDEAQRLHKSELQNLGWEIGSTGDKLDYSQDPEHAQLQAKLKAREDLLKRAHKVGKFIDEDTGEEIQPVQVKSFASEYIRIYNPPKAKE